MRKNRGKILWVDDEIDHLKPHILFLEEKGFNLTTVTNGRDAVEMVKCDQYHLILMDQFMPGMDGMDTCTEDRIHVFNIIWLYFLSLCTSTNSVYLNLSSTMNTFNLKFLFQVLQFYEYKIVIMRVLLIYT